MKLFIDDTHRFVRSAASGVALEHIFFKRRDKIDVEIVFVNRSGVVATPPGTLFSTALKTNFASTEFLALSSPAGLLDLHTDAIEALFADNPASVSALLEVKISNAGEQTRTSTLLAEIENSVILGDEGTPAPVQNLIFQQIADLSARVAALEAAH